MIKLSLSENDLLSLLERQISSFFPFSIEDTKVLSIVLEETLQRLEICLQSKVNNYMKIEVGGGVKFNHLHTTQYLLFLYFLSNTLYKRKYNDLAGKVYYLNKIMHSVDIFYEVEMPMAFGAEHPVGSVIGRASIGNEFYFYQNCTVGSTADQNNNYIHPTIGNNVTMYANSCILGKCNIGDNVNIGPGTIIKNEDVPSNTTVFGISPNLIIKHKYKKYY